MQIYKKLDKNTLKKFHKYNLLESLIKAELIEEKTININLESKKLQEIINNFKNKNNIKNDEEYHSFLRLKNLSQDEFEYQITIPFKIETYCKKNYLSKAESRFLKRKNELDQITYTVIRLNWDNFSLARELYLRIKEENESMNQLSKTYSIGPEKKTNGIVGPINAERMHRELSSILRSCKPGEIIEPKLIESFWMILRLDDYYDAKLDDNMKSMMSLELFMEDISLSISKEVKEVFNPSLLN
tara:strand:- start:174 stop:905 length:732 start_codon:yes stop_codon:yes gene_type:complete